MSNELDKSEASDTLSKSTSNPNISNDNDEVSDSCNNREDYETETFEDDDDEDEETIDHLSLSTLERIRDSQKQKPFSNKTFSAAKIREIERQNTILMNKILAYSTKPSKPKSTTLPKYVVTSSAINRKKNQMKIDWENQILLRKIQSVKPSIKY